MDAKESLYPSRISRRRFMQSFGAGATTAAIVSGVVRPAQAANVIPVNRFGRMFPSLPRFAAQTRKMEQALMDLGKKGGLLDAKDNLTAGPVALITDASLSANNPNNSTHSAGVTFMGQFIDHDLTTLDTTSELAVQTQPEKTINYRTPYFDLDSIYGNGPSRRTELSSWEIRPASRWGAEAYSKMFRVTQRASPSGRCSKRRESHPRGHARGLSAFP